MFEIGYSLFRHNLHHMSYKIDLIYQIIINYVRPTFPSRKKKKQKKTDTCKSTTFFDNIYFIILKVHSCLYTT